MKVLLVAANMETLPDPVFPLGLACVAASLKQRGIDCQVLDLCFAEDFRAELESCLQRGAPGLVCLSLRNVDNVSYPNYISYLPFYRRIVETVRRLSSAPVVLGGSGFSLLPRQLMDYLGADYGVVGEGETALVELARAVAAGRGPAPGTIDKSPVPDLESLPAPDRSGFDNQAYFRLGGMGSIQTKRGCPFSCVYCTYPLIEGRKVRLRCPTSVCDEMETLLELGTDTFFFVDNTFNFPPGHTAAICREIINRRIKVRWSCYAHPGFVDLELVELMQAAGCTGLEFGSDAACQAMLDSLGKGFAVADLERVSAVCRRAGMKFCHSLLLGGPGETMATVRRSLETVQALEPTAAICMVGIRIFPDTALERTARRQGLVDRDQDFLEPVFYLSGKIEDRILPYLENFASQNPTWIFPGLNINMDRRLQSKLRRFGIKGPLWEYMRPGWQRR